VPCRVCDGCFNRLVREATYGVHKAPTFSAAPIASASRTFTRIGLGSRTPLNWCYQLVALLLFVCFFICFCSLPVLRLFLSRVLSGAPVVLKA